MNIFFDMDYTLIGGIDGSPRPNVVEVMERLKTDGHELYVWSGVGIRWRDVKRLGIEHVINDCYVKPLSNYYQSMKKMELPAEPDIVVDDFPMVASAFGGLCIPAYNVQDEEDRVMERVYNALTDYDTRGHSDDAMYRPKDTGAIGPPQRSGGL